MMMQIINFLNLFDMEIINGIFFYDLYIYIYIWLNFMINVFN